MRNPAAMLDSRMPLLQVRRKGLHLIFVFVVLTPAFGLASDAPGRGYPITAVPFSDVRLTDAFWAPRVETNRAVTIPFGFAKSEEEGRIRNFERAARREGPYEGKMPFDDTDVYKLIEGAAYSLQNHPDPELDRFVDGIITKIAAAQETRRIPHDVQDDRSHEEPGRVVEARSEVGPRARGQPRALQLGPPLRGRVRALPRDRQSHAAGRGSQERGPDRPDVRPRQADDPARATRSSRLAW